MALQFNGYLTEIHRGAGTSRTSRWLAADWYDRVLFTAPGASPLFWAPGMEQARPVPGLPATVGYDGVEVFNGRALLWSDDTVKWCAQNDFANWVPVPVTAATGRGILLDDVAAQEISSVIGPVHFEEFSGELAVGQFVRIVSNEADPETITYDYFTVESFANSLNEYGQTLSVDQTVEAGKTAKVFLEFPDAYVEWSEGARVSVAGASTELTIGERSRNQNVVYSASESNNDFLVPEVGGKTHITLRESPQELEPGDVISIAHRSDEAGQDLYEVLQVAQTLTIKRLGVGANQANPGGPVAGAETVVVFQPWVELVNETAANVFIVRNSEIRTITAATLRTLAYTGATPPGERIPSGAVLETLDANDAGEFVNAGSRVNGAVYAITTLAEFAYILKEWSIQSMQDVGRDLGTFYVRTEIHDEGLVGRYAWTRFGDRSIAFIGHKAFYVYTGGQDLRPFADSQWDAFRAEFDRSRADEVVAYHNRPFSEIWFVYPTLDNKTKVLVYNYDAQSITLDEYDSALNGLTAVGMIEWELAPTWESLDYGEKFNSEDKRYYQYVEDGEQEYAILGIGGDAGNSNLNEDPTAEIPRLLLHGRKFSRDSRDDCTPAAYECLAETPDFDWGDPAAVKYLDAVYLSLHVPEPLAGPLTLEVSAGFRMNLDEGLSYSGSQTVSLTGSGNGVTKVNLKATGRYIRLRFRSNTAGAKWSISAYRMMARVGSTW